MQVHDGQPTGEVKGEQVRVQEPLGDGAPVREELASERRADAE